MKWDVMEGDTDSEKIGEVEADDKDQAYDEAMDKHRPGWREAGTGSEVSPHNEIFVRLQRGQQVKVERLDVVLEHHEFKLLSTWVRVRCHQYTRTADIVRTIADTGEMPQDSRRVPASILMANDKVQAAKDHLKAMDVMTALAEKFDPAKLFRTT